MESAKPNESFQKMSSAKSLNKLEGTSILLDIEKDLHRTFPDLLKNIQYKDRFLRSLKKLLSAYALRYYQL